MIIIFKFHDYSPALLLLPLNNVDKDSMTRNPIVCSCSGTLSASVSEIMRFNSIIGDKFNLYKFYNNLDVWLEWTEAQKMTDWLTGWLAGWLTGWLTDWLTDCLADWLSIQSNAMYNKICSLATVSQVTNHNINQSSSRWIKTHLAHSEVLWRERHTDASKSPWPQGGRLLGTRPCTWRGAAGASSAFSCTGCILHWRHL